jgi:hypothetical protein
MEDRSTELNTDGIAQSCIEVVVSRFTFSIAVTPRARCKTCEIGFSVDHCGPSMVCSVVSVA